MRPGHESAGGMPELVESLTCPKCGGPLKLGPGDVIVTCPYCGTASRLRSESPFLLRHGILTARIDRAAATAAVASWLEGGYLKPADLRRAPPPPAPGGGCIPLFAFPGGGEEAYTGGPPPEGANEGRARPGAPG